MRIILSPPDIVLFNRQIGRVEIGVVVLGTFLCSLNARPGMPFSAGTGRRLGVKFKISNRNMIMVDPYIKT
jgi:hypothetical protein